MLGNSSLETTLWTAIAALVSAIDARTTQKELLHFMSDLGADASIVPQLHLEAEAFRRSFLADLDWQ